MVHSCPSLELSLTSLFVIQTFQINWFLNTLWNWWATQFKDNWRWANLPNDIWTMINEYLEKKATTPMPFPNSHAVLLRPSWESCWELDNKRVDDYADSQKLTRISIGQVWCSQAHDKFYFSFSIKVKDVVWYLWINKSWH